MKVQMRIDLKKEGLRVPIGEDRKNEFIDSMELFEARYVDDQGREDDDGDQLQILHDGKWKDAISTDWNFIDGPLDRIQRSFIRDYRDQELRDSNYEGEELGKKLIIVFEDGHGNQFEIRAAKNESGIEIRKKSRRGKDQLRIEPRMSNTIIIK